MDCAHGLALARSASVFRQVVFGLEAVSALGAQRRLREIFGVLYGDPDFEYALIDGTIIKVHRHGTGAKGGLRLKP